MESKDELREIGIKNRTCYYFGDIMNAWDLDIDTDFSSILLEKKLYKEKYENIFNLRHFILNFNWCRNHCV